MDGNTENEADGRGGVGRVETLHADIALPEPGLRLESGEILRSLTIAYESYGEPTAARNNTVFICHALSGDAHVAGYHDDPKRSAGWWDEMIGPGKGIDTRYYHVVCANILGGCRGTTGPASINPATGKAYGSAFPSITVGDIVHAHMLLLEHLGIERLAAVLGGSLGGMQVLEWSVRYPDSAERFICIASAASLSAQALAFDVVGRKAITSDPDWQGGNYYESGRPPAHGLAQARKIGHITYLSQEMMAEKFGRDRRDSEAGGRQSAGTREQEFGTDFEIESYLEYQGNKFVNRFDANSYLHITQAMDEYDVAEKAASLEEAFEPINAKILVVALSSDWLFPAEQSVEIATAMLRAGKQMSYCKLQAPQGHDAFLVNVRNLGGIIRAFLPWVQERSGTADDGRTDTEGRQDGPPSRTAVPATNPEFDRIVEMVQPGTRVVDLGCGGGELLTRLKEQRGITGLGVDIDVQQVIDVIDRGHNICQGDIDAGLSMIPDGSYDYAILSETLQVVRRPRFVLQEMLRVAREGIVSFPNFASFAHRLRLGWLGRMPKGNSLPYEWYNTPNIHLFTLLDFVEVCCQDGIEIKQMMCIPNGSIGRLMIRLGCCNLGSDRVLVRIARRDAAGATARPRVECHG